MTKSEKVRDILSILEKYFPDPQIPLDHKDAYTLLIQSKQDAALGFATLDGAPMNDAADKIRRAGELMAEATVLLQEIARARGLL